MKKNAKQPIRGTEENKEENEVTTNIQRRKGQCIEKRRQQQPRREKRVTVGSSVFRLAFNGTAGIKYGIF